MTHHAQLNAIQFVNDQNAKYIVKKLHVLLAKFIVINHNVMFVALRIYVNQLIALSVKLSALQLNAVLLVLHQTLSAPQCVKKLNATGSARSQLYAHVQSVNLYVKSQLALMLNQLSQLVLTTLVANVMLQTSRHQ